MRLLLSLAPVLLAGCSLIPTAPQDSVSRLRGRIEGLAPDEDARVDVYRFRPKEAPVRMPSAHVDVDGARRFRTELLGPGLYLLALRAPGRPVSTVRTRVPMNADLVLRAREALGRAVLEVRRGAAAAAATGISVSRFEDDLPVAEVRRATLGADGTARLEGLAAGRWTVDLLGTGWTTQVEVADVATASILSLEPPELPDVAAASMRGRVLTVDGRPVPGVAVTIRPLVAAQEGEQAEAWGRYAVTDSDGGYHIVGIPAGRSLVRLECRDTLFDHLPLPEAVSIPPSGEVRRTFVLIR